MFSGLARENKSRKDAKKKFNGKIPQMEEHSMYIPLTFKQEAENEKE